MICHFCGKEMEKGILSGDGRCAVRWKSGCCKTYYCLFHNRSLLLLRLQENDIWYRSNFLTSDLSRITWKFPICRGYHPNLKRLKSPIQAFFFFISVTFPTERIQSLTSAYMGQQGRLLVFHYIDHQLHSKPESGDEHIPLWNRGYVGDALDELV